MRYMVFAGSHYYPYGGWSDNKGNVMTMEEALELVACPPEYTAYDWWQIVDTETRSIVKQRV